MHSVNNPVLSVYSTTCQLTDSGKCSLPPFPPLQVIGALGKGLAKLVFGGGSSKNKDKDKDHSPSSVADRQDTRQQQQQQQYAWLSPAEREKAEQIRSEKERFDYLSSLEQRRGQHVASATGSYDTYGRQEEGEDVPTAPKMVSISRLGTHPCV